MVEIMEVSEKFRDSRRAFAVAVTTFGVLIALFVVCFPEIALHSIQRAVGEVIAIPFLALVAWGVWLFHGHRRFAGWEIHVTNLDGTTDRDPVPPAVVKMWIRAEFSGFGPHGWRDIVETLDRRDNGCEAIKCDAWQARKRKALVIDEKEKRVYVSYPLMKHSCGEVSVGGDNGQRQETAVVPAIVEVAANGTVPVSSTS